MTGQLLERYLRLLGLGPRRPGLDALAEIVRAHLHLVPFENVSKLYRFRARGLTRVPELEEFLDGIEHLHLGSTCYANNAHLNELLDALGYRAKLCGADMSAPDVHLVNVVELDGREYLADVGFGAPFDRPIPLDADADQVIGPPRRDRYVLRPRDAAGRSSLEQWREGALYHGYRLNPTPRLLAHFDGVVAASFRPDAWFMNRLVFASFAPRRSVVVRNLSVTEEHGGEVRRRVLADRGELPSQLEALFGVPRRITAEALQVVKELAPER